MVSLLPAPKKANDVRKGGKREWRREYPSSWCRIGNERGEEGIVTPPCVETGGNTSRGRRIPSPGAKTVVNEGVPVAFRCVLSERGGDEMVDGRKTPPSRVSSERGDGGGVSTRKITPLSRVSSEGGVEGWDVATRRSFCCSQ